MLGVGVAEEQELEVCESRGVSQRCDGFGGCWHPTARVAPGVASPVSLPSAGSRGRRSGWVVSLCCLLVQPLPGLRVVEVKFSLVEVEKKKKRLKKNPQI